jgi:U3 small nucleolar RNA-associated protein 25
VKAEDADYTVLSEYSSFPQVTRARALFFQRRRRLMLYTERAHFYHRYRIRGIQVCDAVLHLDSDCVCCCAASWF